MRNKERIVFGLLLTVATYGAATLVGSKLWFTWGFLPYSFLTHTLMLVLALGLIYGLKKRVDYKLALLELKKNEKPISFGVLTTVIVNLALSPFGGG